MPEGDTLWRTAQRLHAALAGHRVILAELRWGDLATHDLRGATTSEVVSRGKHLLHRFDTGVTLHSHLRMEGQWRIERVGADTTRALARRDLRAVIGSERWTAAGLRLGMLDVIPTREEDRVVGHLGPDVLGADWDLDEAARRLTAYDGYVVDALLDQRTLAGVGTYWASEGLFVERLLPWTPTSDLGSEGTRRLLTRIHALMDRAKDHALQSSTGDRRAGFESYVHGRSRRPCRRCGHPVRVDLTGTPPRQRTIFTCPRCQGGYAPGVSAT